MSYTTLETNNFYRRLGVWGPLNARTLSTARIYRHRRAFMLNLMANRICISVAGTVPEDGVPDMTRLTVLDEEVINKNLRLRYDKDRIYVSFSVAHSAAEI